MDTYDLIVIGAGTTGAYLAREMAKRGRSVLAVEKLPKTKVGTKYDIFHIERKEFATSISDNIINILRKIFPVTSCVTKPMLIKAIADEYHKDYWSVWDKTKHLFEKSSHITQKAARKVPTGEFLSVYPASAMSWNNKRTCNIYTTVPVTDDSRIFYYSNNQKFHFSQQLLKLLERIATRFNELNMNNRLISRDNQFVMELLNICKICNNSKERKEIYLFKDTFYEMINHPDSIYHQTALWLLKELLSEISNDKYYKWKREYYLDNSVFSDELNDFHNKRHVVKIYVALLANHKLRKRYLNF